MTKGKLAMKRRTFIRQLAVTAAVAAAFGTTSVYAQQKTVKIGVLHSLSGTMAISETVLKDVALMAFDEINAKGGVMGRRSSRSSSIPRRTGRSSPRRRASSSPGQGRGRVRLLDVGVAQVGAAGVRGAERPALLPGAVRRRGDLEERVLHRRRAEPAGDPAVEYLMSKEGGGAKRWVLLGTDYVYPRTTNKILRAFLKSKGVADKDIDEKYTPFGHSDYQTIVADIKKFSAGGKTAVVSTINGDSNVPFYKELGNQGLKATDVPVVAFSVGEEELRGVDTEAARRPPRRVELLHVAQEPRERSFTKKWADYTKAKKLAAASKPLTNDPMEATYIGVYMWKQAVEEGEELRHRQGHRGDGRPTFKAPSGIMSKMDEKNHHLHKAVFIGEVKADGQFKCGLEDAWPVKAKPWSRT
jgi:urea transport system substrate-binding protein